MEAIRGKWLTLDKHANIPENIAKAVRILCGHKVTLIIEGEDVKIVAIEEAKQNPLSLTCHEAG